MKILAVLAHPDDEVIFGWPIFQHKHIEKHLICVTGDTELRIKALSKVADVLNFTWECLEIPQGKVSEHLEKVKKTVTEACIQFNPSAVFTHNPHGEYNHPDHLALFVCVHEIDAVRDLFVTDMSISLEGSGFPATPLSISGVETKYYKSPFCKQTRNRSLYDKVRNIYREYKSWTWGRRNINEAGLYFLKQTPRHRRFTLEMLSALLCEVPSSIAELGVYKGITTKHLALCNHVKEVYAVDPWTDSEDYFDRKKLIAHARRSDSHGSYIAANNWEELYHHVHKDLSRFPKIHILRKLSQNATDDVPDDLDMIFIDGDHSYKTVMQDLKLWTPKIKDGGIIAGHDYTWNGEKGDKRGLCRAVNEYFSNHCEEYEPALNPARHPYINREDDRIWWQQKND